MKIKSARILGVFMTLMLVASLVVGIPLTASAGTQAWSSVAVPGATGLVIADADIGPIEVASDGTIYASAYSESVGALFATNAINTYSVLKSTDQGHSFSVTGLVNLATPIVAIVGSPQVAGTVYVATATNLYKSVDAGVSFPASYTIPAVFGAVNALDVTYVGTAHLLVIGTSAGGINTVATLDESIAVPTWTPVGDPAFDEALAVAFSKNFASETSKQIIAVARVGASTIVTSRYGSGAWGSTVGNAPLAGLTLSAASGDSAVIALPSDYSSVAGSNFFYVGVRDAANLAASGVYFITGAAAPTPSTATLRLADNLQSLAVSGAAASATLFVGSADANHVHRSTNAGASWALASKAPTGVSNTYVAVASDFATSNIVYAAVSGAEGAFSVSVEGGVYFNQYALIDTTITTIDQLALAGANTLFMVTSSPSVTVAAIPALAEALNAVVTAAFVGGSTAATFTVNGTGAISIPALAPFGATVSVTSLVTSDVTAVVMTNNGGHTAGAFKLVDAATGLKNFGTFTLGGTVDGALPNETVAVDVTTPFNATANYTVTYVNQLDMPGRTGSVAITAATTGTFTPQSGDTVRDVTAVVLFGATTATVGTFEIKGTATATVYSTTSIATVFTNGAKISDAASAVVTTAFAGGTGPLTFTVTYLDSTGTTATTGTISIPANSPAIPPTIVPLGVPVNDITGVTVTALSGHTAGAFEIQGVATYAIVGALATVTLDTFADGAANVGTLAVTTYPNSVWRTASALTGGGWARIALEMPTAPIPTVVGASNAYATDNTAFLATGLVVKKSTNANAAALFTAVTTPLAANANAIQVVDPSTVYVGTAAGVQRTINAGLDWPVSTGVTGPVVSLALSGTNVLAGNSAGSVYLSINSGASFRQLTGAALAGAGANTSVAFDPGFATNLMVYANFSGATAIVRVTVGTSATTDVAATIGAVTTGSTGIVAIAGPTGLPATLYVADATADVAPARSINPNAAVAAIVWEPTGPDAVSVALPGTPTLSGLVGMVTASNTLWAIDTTGLGVLAFTDTLAIQPTGLTSVATSPTSAVVSWTAVTNATSYVVTVTAPFGAAPTTVTLGAGANITSAGITVMTTGAAYTFTVNVATPDLSYASAAAPLTTQPGPPPWDPSQNALGTIAVAPAPGATLVPTTPTLQWNSSTAATGFELLISTSSATTGNRLTTGDIADKTGANALVGNNATVYTVTTALSNSTTYFWQVRAVLGADYSPWSAVFAFTTAAPVVTPTTTITSVVVSVPPPITITQTQTTITIPPPPAQPTPAWVWAIIAIGGVLLVVVVILIARTRKI